MFIKESSFFSLFALLITLLLPCVVARAQTPVEAGYRDFAYGNSPNSTPTGEKPESKLWWNDGSWWSVMFSPITTEYQIYELNLSDHTWTDTGTVVDTRNGIKLDALWDAATDKLYVLTHNYSANAASSSSSSNWGRVYRFSYSRSTRRYTKDAGFPVNVTRGKSEAAVLAKDSTGRLWVTYVENATVMVNHSTTSETVWGTPSVLPVDPALAKGTTDDLSSVIAFSGKIGIMWSNQLTRKFYFAIHQDGAPDNSWTVETPLPQPGGTENSDDHINLKVDSAGRVYAAIKTSLTVSTDPLNMLLRRDAGGQWSSYTFGLVRDHHTRPIVQLDESAGKLYFIATAPESGGAIYYKSSDLENPSFTGGLGTLLIKSALDNEVNNSTSTKQNLDSASGLLVLASDAGSHRYLHGFVPLAASNSPSITSFTPASGDAGTNVTITGQRLSNTTAVAFNGTSATFTAINDTELQAQVPSGATSGQISVTNPFGTALSSSNFTVTVPAVSPVIDSFTPASGPVGTSVVITGSGFTGTTAVSFNGTAASYSVDSDAQITTAVPSGASSGAITVTNSAGSATSNSSFTVTVPVDPPAIDSFTPASGAVGTSVVITGSGFTGTTAVSFNGTAATYSVDSDAQLTTAVPSGASSGAITVTNSTGTATSNNAFTVTTASSSTITLPPTADAQVKSDSAPTNYGSLDTLRVRQGTLSSPTTYHSYLRFQVSGLGSQITSAKLRVFVTDKTNDTVAVSKADNTWTESTLNWNNRPTALTPITTQSTLPLGVYVDIPLPTSLFAGGDGDYTLVLTSNGTDSLIFSSRESASPPLLIIQQ